MNVRAAARLASFVVALACGCSKEEPASQKELRVEPRSAMFPSLAAPPAVDAGEARGASAGAAATAPTSPPFVFDHESLAEAAAARRTITLTRSIEAGPPPVDPDRALLDDAHMRAARCYDGQIFGDPGPRSAKVDLTVIPSGQVTRAEVRSSDTREPAILACLKALGEGLRFAERPDGAGLRTYAIDVGVVPTH